MSIGPFFGYGAALVGIGAIIYSNLPTRLTLGSVVPTIQYLADTKLTLLEPSKAPIASNKEIVAKDLFEKQSPLLIMVVRRPGCAFCRREASKISEVASKLKEKNPSLVGIVHETLGVDEFRPFLKNADIYYDSEKRFYGPQERWLPMWMGFLRVSTYLNGYVTSKEGFSGNTAGEGRLLGGVYLIDKDRMLFSHLEKEWGDEVDINGIITSAKKL